MTLQTQSKLSCILILSCKLCLTHLDRLMGYIYRVEQVDKYVSARAWVRAVESAWMSERKGELVSWGVSA